MWQRFSVISKLAVTTWGATEYTSNESLNLNKLPSLEVDLTTTLSLQNGLVFNKRGLVEGNVFLIYINLDMISIFLELSKLIHSPFWVQYKSKRVTFNISSMSIIYINRFTEKFKKCWFRAQKRSILSIIRNFLPSQKQSFWSNFWCQFSGTISEKSNQ